MLKPRTMVRSPFVIFICLTSFIANAQQLSTNALMDHDIISLKPADIFCNTDRLLQLWSNEPVPISFYTQEDIDLQHEINAQVSDAIRTYSPERREDELHATGIDEEDITPYTWKWIHLTLVNEDGSEATIHLRRPNWWIKAIGADSVGRYVSLVMPEVGIVGNAQVVSIYVNSLDTRFWNNAREGDYVNRPITGKFIQQSNEVYHVYLAGHERPLGITGAHLVWSADRKQWVRVDNLVQGERVKVHHGTSRVASVQRQDGTNTIYHIEVYKDHNYLASLHGVVIHNSCRSTAFENLKRMAHMGEEICTASAQYKSRSQVIDGVKLVFIDAIKEAPVALGRLSPKVLEEVVEEATAAAKREGGFGKLVLKISPDNVDLKAVRRKMWRDQKIGGLSIDVVDDVQGIELSSPKKP